MPPPVGDTWELFLDARRPHGPSEIDLRELRLGDRVLLATKNTQYTLEWRADGSALLSSDRSDRPFGQVSVIGCAFRRSGALAQGVLFCGGRMEYASSEGKVRHRTTAILSIKVENAVAKE